MISEETAMEQPAPTPPSDPSPPDHQVGGAFATIAYLARDLLLAVIIAFVIIFFIYQPVRVEGTSMMPSLADQERIFVNIFAYKLGLAEIHRGDTVVFRFPQDPSKHYIKRVIAVPGDMVEVRNGTVVLNGQPQPEAYVPEEYRDRMSVPALRIGREQYFVMGDHRSSSNDSRAWGPVDREHIYGKAVFVYWPLGRLGVLR
jgi:signal peptidase I